MKTFRYIFLMGSFVFWGGCFSSEENLAFEGDGEVFRLDSPAFFGTGGWRVQFEQFTLSAEHSVKYSFRGLPTEGKLKQYLAYFYVPAGVDALSLKDAQLELILHKNGAQVASFKSHLENWTCFSFAPNSKGTSAGDGLAKNYYSLDLRIPAVPENQYTLCVNYSPPVNMSSEEVGYIYLSLGGFK